MPFCPKCAAEYRPGVKVCPECQVALTDTPPPEPLPEEPLIAAFDAPEEVTAITARDLLRQAGIPFVEQMTSVTVLDHIDTTLEQFFSRFLVPASRAEEAAQLIRGYLAAPDISQES